MSYLITETLFDLKFGNFSLLSKDASKQKCVCKKEHPLKLKYFPDLSVKHPKACAVPESLLAEKEGEVVFGVGDKKITFILEKGVNLDLDVCEKLLQIYNLISELNEIIPSRKIREVEITAKGDTLYNGYVHTLQIKLDESFLEYTAHEMGHAIYAILFDESKDEVWQKIYYLSLGYETCELVDDSNYIDKDDNYGHPHDNASELFASSLMVYRLHADKLLEKIKDPNADKEAQKRGKLIFAYMRDKVFKGKVFSKNDPVPKQSFKIQYANIEISLLSALCDSNYDIQKAASYVIGEIGDDRLIDPLSQALESENPNLRFGAAKAIGKLGISDKKFIDPLINALKDENKDVRWAAAEAIGELEIKNKKAVKFLISSLKDKEYMVKGAAANALGVVGNKKAIPALKKLANEEHGNEFLKECVQESAQEAIDKIKAKNK